jgi:hypothetical protein
MRSAALPRGREPQLPPPLASRPDPGQRTRSRSQGSSQPRRARSAGATRQQRAAPAGGGAAGGGRWRSVAAPKPPSAQAVAAAAAAAAAGAAAGVGSGAGLSLADAPPPASLYPGSGRPAAPWAQHGVPWPADPLDDSRSGAGPVTPSRTPASSTGGSGLARHRRSVTPTSVRSGGSSGVGAGLGGAGAGAGAGAGGGGGGGSSSRGLRRRPPAPSPPFSSFALPGGAPPWALPGPSALAAAAVLGTGTGPQVAAGAGTGGPTRPGFRVDATFLPPHGGGGGSGAGADPGVGRERPPLRTRGRAGAGAPVVGVGRRVVNGDGPAVPGYSSRFTGSGVGYPTPSHAGGSAASGAPVAAGPAAHRAAGKPHSFSLRPSTEGSGGSAPSAAAAPGTAGGAPRGRGAAPPTAPAPTPVVLPDLDALIVQPGTSLLDTLVQRHQGRVGAGLHDSAGAGAAAAGADLSRLSAALARAWVAETSPGAWCAGVRAPPGGGAGCVGVCVRERAPLPPGLPVPRPLVRGARACGPTWGGAGVCVCVCVRVCAREPPPPFPVRAAHERRPLLPPLPLVLQAGTTVGGRTRGGTRPRTPPAAQTCWTPPTPPCTALRRRGCRYRSPRPRVPRCSRPQVRPTQPQATHRRRGGTPRSSAWATARGPPRPPPRRRPPRRSRTTTATPATSTPTRTPNRPAISTRLRARTAWATSPGTAWRWCRRCTRRWACTVPLCCPGRA